MGNKGFDPIRLAVFDELFTTLTEEMGEVLRAAAPSVNIRERMDFSCALFDERAEQIAQAAHIPVHLGSAGLSVRAARRAFPELEAGSSILLNDPFQGGTHLPDLTLITAVAMEGAGLWFVVNRAHHADIGGASPGSMGIQRDLIAEGLVIPPVLLEKEGRLERGLLSLLKANTRTPEQREGDLRAQLAANHHGARNLASLCRRYGSETLRQARTALRDYAERLARARLMGLLKRGSFEVSDVLEGDGVSEEDIPLRLRLEVLEEGGLHFDFRESAPQGPGCLNANPAVVRAAVLYCLRCLLGEGIPQNGGLEALLRISTKKGSILDPLFPAAVAGGNVETSQRLVDLCFAALGEAGADVPAQSQGTMNNLSFGGVHPETGRAFVYYETLGGGAGASSEGPGGSGVQTHMTNTRNTPVEELERSFPVVVEALGIRRGSGGKGKFEGGEGICKLLRAEVDLRWQLIGERRR
ncbi:MAG TPA: hydantoinase B/oxoprolinase family protein, partial [Planctomycetes bacterium]|nr:hydantoinase B/oxoprolinase family protein [Planctomycetota bacterium]